MSQGSTLALMGQGMSGELADLIGADYKLFVGVGTSQTGATVLTTQNCELSASSGQTAFILPGGNVSGSANIMDDYWITNQSATATSALIFVPSGHKLNGVTNGNINSGGGGLAQFKSCILWQYKYQNWTYLMST